MCVESLIDPGNGNGLTDEMILFDLDYSFVATNEPINIDEINTLKNKSIMIENDFIIDDEEMHAIIKEGTYGVTNGKMITLVSEVVE